VFIVTSNMSRVVFFYRRYELISNLKSKFANVCDRVVRFDNIIDIAQRHYETREEKRISENS